MERRINRQTEQIRTLLAESREQATLDPLTMCYNRRFLMQRMDELVALHARHGDTFALLMIDLDHFKEINDRWGHLCGDEVLRQVADILRGLSRTSDVCARFGGEEFCILLPNSPREGARLLGERIRLKVIGARQKIACAHGWPQAVSIGAAEYQANEGIENFLSRADAALYAAKTQGRNRVVVR